MHRESLRRRVTAARRDSLDPSQRARGGKEFESARDDHARGRDLDLVTETKRVYGRSHGVSAAAATIGDALKDGTGSPTRRWSLAGAPHSITPGCTRRHFAAAYGVGTRFIESRAPVRESTRLRRRSSSSRMARISAATSTV